MIKTDPGCANCNKAGLAILPVRYAVFPKGMSPRLPTTLKAPQVKSIALQHHQYVLRTLRAGFIYVFHEKRWAVQSIPELAINFAYEAYSVNEKGFLSKQHSAVAARSIENEKVCTQESHYAPTSVIAIKNPEKAGVVWIAFSEHKWSRETLEEYGKDAKRRAQRMQKIEPAKLIDTPEHDDGFVATVQNLKEIVEYRNTAPTAIMPPIVNAKFSEDDGDYDKTLLKSVGALYPVEMRTEVMAKDTIEFMQAIGQASDGKKPNAPLVLALWDGIGITHELNGYRNEPAGRIHQYGQERELEISTLNAIEGVKKALEEKTAASADAQIKTAHSLPQNQDLDNRAMRARALYQYEPAKLNAELQAIDQERARRAKARKAGAEKFKKDQLAVAWPKYEAKLNTRIFDLFKKNHSSFLDAAAKVIDDRTDDLMAWLESQALIDALTEYHPANILDGIAFEDKVGEAIFGIGSSEKGVQKIKKWVTGTKEDMQKNLLWRAIALNQEQGLAEVRAALKEAEQHKTAQTLAVTLTWSGYTAKTLKAFADTHKKAASIFNANTTASSDKGSTAFGAKINPVKTRGIDRIAMTVGDVVLRHFRVDGLADYASEKIIQHIFSIRAFVEPADSANLIMAQAKNDALARQQILGRLRTAKTFLAADSPSIQSAQAENLTAAWNEFKQKNSGAGNAIKDARLALLVGLVEALNFSKLMGDCATKNDAKSWWSLGASAMNISSALFDIGSVPAKSLFGNESWSYQKLKLFGGVLSAGATFIGAGIDWVDAEKAKEKGYMALNYAYRLKFALGVGSGALTLATTFTYAAPVIGRLTGSTAVGTAVGAVGARAVAIIGARILFMSVGAWITVGSFAIQVFIWMITDDELQDWTDHCAFGRNRNNAWDAKIQYEQFLSAIKAVGVA